MTNTEIVKEFFRPSEFLCDGVVVIDQMNPDFLVKLVELRRRSKVPFKVNSCWRSAKKNKDVGGASNSMHLIGRAVDIHCPNDKFRAIVCREALAMGLTVGIMENGLHIDDRDDQIVFHYYAKYKRV